MGDFSFMYPEWFFAALPLALLLPWLKNKAHNAGLIAPHLAKLLSTSATSVGKNTHWPLSILGIAWLLSVIALAGPSWQKREMPVISLEGARVLVMDMSRSMYATDITPNRLTQARFKALDMLPSWKEGSTGLVTYAADGYIVSPLTSDAITLKTLIPNLSPNIMPIPGSNAAAGVQQAIDLLKQAGFAQGDIIIITDGMTTRESDATLAALKNTNYRVSILAIGTEQGAPIRLPDGRLLEQFGQPVIAKLVLSTLSPITQQTGGILQMWQPSNRDVENIVAFTTTPLNGKSQQSETVREEKINDGFWLLLPILILTLLGFRRGLILTMLVILLPQPSPLSAAPFETDDQGAYLQFQAGEYQQAASRFQSPSWKGIAQYKAGDYQGAIDTLSTLPDNTSRYNLGNAYAQAGDLESALKSYETVLKADPTNADAKSNIEVIKKALEQQQKDQDQEKDKDKDKDKDNQSSKKEDQSDKPKDDKSQKDQKQQNDKGEQQQDGQQQKQQGQEEQKNDEQSQSEQSSSNQQKDQQGKNKQPDEQNSKSEQAKQDDIKSKEESEDETDDPSKPGSEKEDPQDETGKQSSAKAGQGDGKENKDGLTASHPVLKKLEQVPDNTAELIQAQLYLQAQQKEKPKPTENAW